MHTYSETTRPQSSTAKQRHAVEIRNLRVEFHTGGGTYKSVIRDLDLAIPLGQFVVLVGRSGCGKTTLLNLVAGLVEPTSGSVEVLGRPPREQRRQLGFMLARDALLPWRTARRNVEYGLELRGWSKRERRRAAEGWLEAVHLAEAGGLWPWQLSQGMRQRVALARTWALDPEILLMDEPFAALDAHTRVSVQRQFLDLWQGEKSRTVIFVTHDLGEAISLADRVVLLGEGQILDDVSVDLDRPRDLMKTRTDPRFIELYDRLRRRLSE